MSNMQSHSREATVRPRRRGEAASIYLYIYIDIYIDLVVFGNIFVFSLCLPLYIN